VHANTHEHKALLKSILQNLLTLDPLLKKCTPEWCVSREIPIRRKSQGNRKVDFLIETLEYRIMIECKFKATEVELKKGWKQLCNYMFPVPKSEHKRTWVRLLFNFYEGGIYPSMGAKYNATDYFLTNLFQDVRKKGIVCDLCEPPKNFSQKASLYRHIKEVHEGHKRKPPQTHQKSPL